MNRAISALRGGCTSGIDRNRAQRQTCDRPAGFVRRARLHRRPRPHRKQPLHPAKLRERGADVLLLAAELLSDLNRKHNCNVAELTPETADLFRAYDYAGARSETEAFFWSELADNYVEMAKTRLYDAQAPTHGGARYALYHVLLAVVKLFAPILPYVTDEIYRGLFAGIEGQKSVHVSAWPVADAQLTSAEAEVAGEALVEVATAVRRYKSAHALSLGAPLDRVHVATHDAALAALLREARADIASVTRAKQVEIGRDVAPVLEVVATNRLISIGVAVETTDERQ